MLKAVVTGAGGKMGGRIIGMIARTEGITVTGAVEQPGHPFLGREAGTCSGGEPLGINVTDELATAAAGADVLIDFTHHTASVRHLELAAQYGLACVIGSTGFTPEEMARVRELSREVRCVLAPNMSIGVNVMYRVLRDVARVLGDYDVEIIEAHHNAKKDAPSGTALRMAEVIATALGRDLTRAAVYARHGDIGARRPEEIGIQTVRAGDIVGEHMVHQVRHLRREHLAVLRLEIAI